MKAFWTIGLLIISNIFMTFAWYGHLKMKQTFSWFEALPLIGVVASRGLQYDASPVGDE